MTKNITVEFLRSSSLDGGKLYVNYEDLMNLLDSHEDAVDLLDTSNKEIKSLVKSVYNSIRQDVKGRRKSISI